MTSVEAIGLSVDKPSVGVVDTIASNMSVMQFDFVVALIGFLLVRYYAPNVLLGRDHDLLSGLVFAFFYAIFGTIRSVLLSWKETTTSKYQEMKYNSYYERDF
tara:strand:+ start:6195 stop:6503 length:309 start_codon:yes stop_codon:yes gene_type:complete